MSGNHSHSHAPNNIRGLSIALIITSSIMILEFFGGLITNSLALLSDSGHMLSDVGSLSLSLIALWFAKRPPSSRKTFGFYRFEILAALFNGISLFAIAGFIAFEAYGRFFEPPTVASGMMMIIATVGLLANIISAFVLTKKSDTKENVNVRSAYLHILADALGSVGAIVAGGLMLLFGWYVADPIISVVVSLLIFKSAWSIMKKSLNVLMEGTPLTVDADKVKQTLKEIDGVKDVHDLHIWTITSGLESLTCHLLVDKSMDHQEILKMSIEKIEEEFRIQHTTIQIENVDFQHSEQRI